MNDNQQKTASSEQLKDSASGGALPQKQIVKNTRYREVQTDTLDAQILHWQILEERATHCPESLTPQDSQHLDDYRELYGEYQFRIASMMKDENIRSLIDHLNSQCLNKRFTEFAVMVWAKHYELDAWKAAFNEMVYQGVIVPVEEKMLGTVYRYEGFAAGDKK